MRMGDRQEVASWLARLLVVRSCGYIEQAATETVTNYTREKSYGLVRTFSLGALNRPIQNPRPTILEEFVGRFDEGLRQDLAVLLDADDQILRRELDFLVDRRNKIAHGLNESVGVAKALRLKDVACEIADWFILRFRPT
jgi:hypothetical protein